MTQINQVGSKNINKDYTYQGYGNAEWIRINSENIFFNLIDTRSRVSLFINVYGSVTARLDGSLGITRPNVR